MAEGEEYTWKSTATSIVVRCHIAIKIHQFPTHSISISTSISRTFEEKYWCDIFSAKRRVRGNSATVNIGSSSVPVNSGTLWDATYRELTPFGGESSAMRFAA